MNAADETRSDDVHSADSSSADSISQQSADDPAVLTETAPEGDAGDEATAAEAEYKMSLGVEVEDAGPCRKHIQVTVPRADIDHFYDEALQEILTSAEVPGFRKGHAPRKLLERRFRQELGDQVKQKVLLQSLEYVAETEKLDPINEPNIDIESIDIPEEGDFEYEFDVEVRPDFDLPDYQGLTIDRPVRDISDADVDAYLKQFLRQYGELLDSDEPVCAGDFVTVDVEFAHNGQPLQKIHSLTVEVRPVLQFQDAELEGFDELMSGAKPGDVRTVQLNVSQECEALEMRNETVDARITVQRVRRESLPELSKEFLERINVESAEDLRGTIRDILERQITYRQRQTAREQVLEKITESADWDLPEQLVLRQVENARRREILEMQQAGFTTREIQARDNEIRNRAVSTTRQALKEHFVLDKIASENNLEVTGHDIDLEINMMAMQSGESPRRVRARLQKSGMDENLEAQIRERKAIDFILESAEFQDVEDEAPVDDRVAAVGRSICGTRYGSGEEAATD